MAEGESDIFMPLCTILDYGLTTTMNSQDCRLMVNMHLLLLEVDCTDAIRTYGHWG